MASTEAYAQWLVENKGKKGTPDFDKVASAYIASRNDAPDDVVEPEKESPTSIGNLVGAATEPIISMATGIPATIAGGLGGLGSMATNAIGLTDVSPADVVNSIRSAMTYEPGTQGGKNAMSVLSYPFQKWGEMSDAVASRQNDVNRRSGESPEFGAIGPTITKTIMDVIPMAVMGSMVNGKPALPKMDKAINWAGEKAAAPIKRISEIAANAVLNRLPGGHERAVGEVINKMAGERTEALIDALTKAKEGESAGQAATNTGVYEFSALQKYAESKDPSGYGAISKKQQADRVNSIKEWAKTPEDVDVARAVLSKNAEINYGKSRDDLIDSRGGIEKLETAAQKAKIIEKEIFDSKVKDLQDAGKYNTFAAQQKTLGEDFSPIAGEARIPARYTPHTENALRGNVAAEELKSIAAQKLTKEKAMSDISETFLLNRLGEGKNDFSKFITRPSVIRAINVAKEAAAEKGSYFPAHPGERFSVQNLQRIKRAITENLEKEAKSGTLEATTKAEISKTASDFTQWLRDKSPEFAKAEDAFIAEIKPIKQMEIGQALIERLEPRLGSQERVTQFANAIKDQEKIVRNETGRSATLKEVLEPKQNASIEKAMSELNRDAEMSFQAKKGMAAMNEKLGSIYDLPQLSLLERAIVIANSIMKKIEGYNTDATMLIVVKEMRNPKKMAEIIKRASPKERAMLEQAHLLLKKTAVGGAIESLNGE